MVDTKIHEINYPKKLDDKGRKWLNTKPFGVYNRDESRRIFQDFATVLFLINKYDLHAKRILELGCGPGWLSIFLGKMGYEISGYDISPDMIEVARRRAKEESIEAKFEVADIEDERIAGEVNKNDVAIIYDSLHHCQSDEKVVEKCFNYLKKGGILIIAEPNVVHGKNPCARRAVDQYEVTERGVSHKSLIRICRKLGFKWIKRYHASGQSFAPRNESAKDTVKMLLYPFLARFYYGNRQTRVWLVAQK